jgi:hypothetical protein
MNRVGGSVCYELDTVRSTFVVPRCDTFLRKLFDEFDVQLLVVSNVVVVTVIVVGGVVLLLLLWLLLKWLLVAFSSNLVDQFHFSKSFFVING